MSDALFTVTPRATEVQQEREAAHQIAICTSDPYCQADADEHDPGCPIEAELRDTFGF